MATKNLIKFGVPESEIKSKTSCFLVIENEWPLISIDAFIYDWNRIQEIQCVEKVK